MDPAKEAAGKLGAYAYTQSGTNERGISQILKDTVSNVQDIIRSEVQLAKVETKEELRKAGSAGVMFGAAAAVAFYGLGFCLLCVVYALSLALPSWAAALIVGVALLIAGAIALSVGRARWKQVNGPKKTMFTVKEDVAWIRSQNKS